MTEIKYYPLIDCNTEGEEKIAMFPTPDSSTVQAQSEMWLEEMIPHYFRLCTKKSSSADSFNIHCPRCGTAMKRISGDINETKRGLYACSACAKK